MSRGRYAQRADSRLKVLESEALQKATVKINELEAQLRKTRNELASVKQDITNQAMRAATHLSSREKQDLRNQIASLEHQTAKDRIRNAVLVWEAVHRVRFGEPSPERIPFGSDDPEGDSETRQLWYKMNWEIPAIFGLDFDEIMKFFRIVEGFEWGIKGEVVGRTSREATRSFKKGIIRDALMVRERKRQDYYELVWQTRQAGGVEPIHQIQVPETPEDVRADLVNKIRGKKGR